MDSILHWSILCIVLQETCRNSLSTLSRFTTRGRLILSITKVCPCRSVDGKSEKKTQNAWRLHKLIHCMGLLHKVRINKHETGSPCILQGYQVQHSLQKSRKNRTNRYFISITKWSIALSRNLEKIKQMNIVKYYLSNSESFLEKSRKN